MVCASNQNRSMEAHALLAARGYQVQHRRRHMLSTLTRLKHSGATLPAGTVIRHQLTDQAARSCRRPAKHLRLRHLVPADACRAAAGRRQAVRPQRRSGHAAAQHGHQAGAPAVAGLQVCISWCGHQHLLAWPSAACGQLAGLLAAVDRGAACSECFDCIVTFEERVVQSLIAGAANLAGGSWVRAALPSRHDLFVCLWVLPCHTLAPFCRHMP